MTQQELALHRSAFLGGEIEHYDPDEEKLIRGPIKEMHIGQRDIVVFPHWMATKIRADWHVVTCRCLTFPIASIHELPAGRIIARVKHAGTFTLFPKHDAKLDPANVIGLKSPPAVMQQPLLRVIK